MTAVLPTPLFFGPPDCTLFGQFHGVTAPRAALLVCPPMGREDISAYASLIRLAEAAAQAGVATLRFDYAGCGNSAGDDTEPARLQAWTRSVGLAIDQLKNLAGTDRVIVLGVRIGALLAHLACEDRHDVAALIAVAPVVSGRAYVRELRALQMTSGTVDASAGASAVLEAGGFVISDETRDALSGIDLLKRERPPAPRVLVIDRDDMPASQKWLSSLQALGAQVDHQAQPGYAAMMADPHFAEPPESMIAAVVRWVQDLSPSPQACSDAAPATSNSAQLGTNVKETAVWLGNQPSLFGIVSEPSGAAPAPSARAILLLNAGATRLIGPNRMVVPLARRWAAAGHTVLRLDIAGLGDSPAASGQPGNVVYSPQALDDVAAAIDWLRQRTGRSKVQLVGLCSGAYHSFRAAAAGMPVESAVMINPLTFFWKEGMSLDPAELQDFQVAGEVMRHRQSVWQLGTWAKLLRGEIGLQRLTQVLKQWSGWTAKKIGQTTARALGMKFGDDLAADLRSIAKHGIKQHYIFADTDPGLELLRAQGGAVVQQLQERGLLTIDLVSDADHTFTWRAPRERMLDVLVTRVEQAD